MPPQVVCENIGPRQVRKRRFGGVALLAVAIGLAVALLVLDAPRLLRLLLFLPLCGAALGYYQARERT